MEYRFKFTLIVSMSAFALSMGALAQVAKVNGVTIPQSRADIMLKEVTAQGRPDSAELRSMIKERLIEGELLSQDAIKKGINKNPQVAAEIEIVRQKILAQALIADHLKRNPSNDDALKKAFEQVKSNPAATEYKARHILVNSESDAKEIIAQINKGADFAKLAAEKSTDEGSKAQGGELPWGLAMGYVRPFGEALTKLNKGQMTELPVQTNFGWHIILLDDKRPPTIEAIRPQLVQMVEGEAVMALLKTLRSKAKVE